MTEARGVHMTDHVMPDGMSPNAGSAARGGAWGVEAEGPTGKPYRWQLPHVEQPSFVALPPEAIAAPLSRAAAFHREVVERTAAFLIVVSRNNAYEGRDPTLVCDDLSCGTVAGLLGFDINVLGLALTDLEGRGLISCTAAGGLRLTDIAALDKVSDGL